MYIFNVTSRIKDNAFQINRLLQTEVKRRKIQVKKQKNAKFIRMQNLWLYSAKLSHRNKHKHDCRTFQLIKQLETLEKRAIIYNFVL